MARVWVSQLEFNDGTRVEIDKNDIVVFVGPNNAGKSVTLKEIQTSIQNSGVSRHIVRSRVLQNEGDVDDVNAFLRESGLVEEVNSFPNKNYSGHGYNVNSGNIPDWWANLERGLEGLAGAFVLGLGTE